MKELNYKTNCNQLVLRFFQGEMLAYSGQRVPNYDQTYLLKAELAFSGQGLSV